MQVNFLCLFYKMVINSGASSMGLLWGLRELIYAKYLRQRMAHRKNKILVIILVCMTVFIITNVLSLRNHFNHDTFQRTSKWKIKEISLPIYFKGEILYNFVSSLFLWNIKSSFFKMLSFITLVCILST